ncbi:MULTISPECIES: UL36 very large tegument protein [unclassified Streptomyces]|uniref:UL36 very large tegument protein n=1 Tax=unclassified Streptomyces TaxID=2593676 RepID=UPI0036F8C1C0
MTVTHIPPEMAEFTHWLGGLAARAERAGGWWAVFAERDPDGLGACLEGTELLPWDVVASLLQDVGEDPGHARGLYAAAAGVHDLRPGGAEALAARRALMEDERRHAGARIQELDLLLLTHPDPDSGEAARLAHDLAWTRDDLARATARIADLTDRLDRLRAAPAPGTGPDGGPPPAPERRRPRGARYAWVEDDAGAGGPAPSAVPEPPAGGAEPRGARFRLRTAPRTDPTAPAAPGAASGPAHAAPGSASAASGSAPAAPGAASAVPDEAEEAARAAVNAVYALRRLRAQGRTGEAHVLLCEALVGPPARLPALAGELHRAGFGADWGTLLWEAASLPPARLAAVAGALADAGRADDCEQLLRQGLARPVEELAGAVAALVAEGHDREARALLTAFLRVRTPEEAARLAAVHPALLVPRLGAAARALSAADDRALRHALRVGGVLGD